MCLTCGCMKPHDDHGKDEYLTIEDLEAGARLDEMSLDDAVRNLVKTSTSPRRSRRTSTVSRP